MPELRPGQRLTIKYYEDDSQVDMSTEAVSFVDGLLTVKWWASNGRDSVRTFNIHSLGFLSFTVED